MVFTEPHRPLRAVEVPQPEPGPGQLLIKVHACGVCRTDLHLLDNEIKIDSPPRVLGHQIVGTVVPDGRRVGVPWLGWTDGTCKFCRSERENLCPNARFTGRDIDGGFAEYTVADERFCFPIPDGYPDLQAAPLLCAGLIGYRCLRMCGEAQTIGLYGFGASAHIICQVIAWQRRRAFAFTRPGDIQSQEFARELGADWAGDSDASPPEPLEAAIIFAPAGGLVPGALRALEPGGVLVCGGIYMSPIPELEYELLWHERQVRSVANLTRRDGHEFLGLAPQVPVQTHITTYALGEANEALDDLRHGRFRGAAVLTMED